MTETLVLSQAAIRDEAVLARDLHHIKVANREFGLGIEPRRFPSKWQIVQTWNLLAFPCLDSSQELFYMAIAKQLSRQTRRLIEEDGMKDDRRTCELLRELGFPERAAIREEWHDLSDKVDLRIITDGEHSYADLANREDIEEAVSKLSQRYSEAVAESPLTHEQVEDIICDTHELKLVPLDDFNTYWTDRIVVAPGFGTFEPEPDDDESWHLANTPYGWLTRRHGAALERHGYKYRFAFWEQEIGDTRGHLWVQTDRGPLRLTDGTDATSLRSNFPVRVSDVSGHQLFDLLESDVPDRLLRSGPDL